MAEIDYDDPKIEEAWCEERRIEVATYLKNQGVIHGRIGDWPAWHVVPYVSIWAIESAKSPEWVGWWVICGDLPTDYISAETIKHPRTAMKEIAERWLDFAARLKSGEPHAEMRIDATGNQMDLIPLLERRALTLLEWSQDESCWGSDYE